jgi:plasmid maintenance system antidote protein VapI
MDIFKDFINREFDLRSSKNGSYSLRAFARDLGISPQRLSHLLSGKKGISKDAPNLY